jgi:hypothetical protein
MGEMRSLSFDDAPVQRGFLAPDRITVRITENRLALLARKQ